MIGEATVEERDEQPYVGIRREVPMAAVPEAVEDALNELYPWLEARGLKAEGAPFIRYHVINMERELHIEPGVPVAEVAAGDARVSSGVLPAGRYASLVYQGVENAIDANGALLQWGADHGLVWDQWESEQGDGFGSRVEFLLSGPEDDPDPATWETEVAIRLAD